MKMREALYYQVIKPHEDKQTLSDVLQCLLCPRACILHENQNGYCRGKKATGGKLYALNYAEAVSLAIDPIEKKPLYHYHPGTQILSLGPNSCNLSCSYCQNWQISQQECATREVSIVELASLTRGMKPKQVAFTYSEPLMWYEYIWDFAQYAPDVDIVLVTNAFINETPWMQMMQKVKAVNIDLKAYREEFYKEQCGGDLDTIKRNIRIAYESGVHVELTNLLIPGLNNSSREVDEMASFIASIDERIPLHISAYHPQYKLQIRASLPQEIEAACDIAATHLKHVYAGNCNVPKYSQRKR